MRSTYFHIRAASKRCCHKVPMVALLLHVITIIRTASRWCCPDVRTVVILLHVFPYQGPRLDDVAQSSGRMQLYSHIRVCEGKSITCRTMMSFRTCCHDVRTNATLNCKNLLDTIDVRIHDWAVKTKTWDPTSLSWNLHKIFFKHLEPLFWNEDSEINSITDKMATLHNSDFVKQNAANTN